MNIFKKIKLFKEYKKSIKEHQEIFENQFGLEYNNWYELYTTISFKDTPEELINSTGMDSIVEVEIKKYIRNFSATLENINLYEFINLYEIKKLNNYNYGITFGYSLSSNRSIIITKILMYLIPIIIATITGLIII